MLYTTLHMSPASKIMAPNPTYKPPPRTHNGDGEDDGGGKKIGGGKAHRTAAGSRPALGGAVRLASPLMSPSSSVVAAGVPRPVLASQGNCSGKKRKVASIAVCGFFFDYLPSLPEIRTCLLFSNTTRTSSKICVPAWQLTGEIGRAHV